VTPGDLVEGFLRANAIDFARAGDAFSFALAGEKKRSMRVTLTVRESRVSLEAFFVRRPIDNAAEVYRMLLARNLRGGPVRFAADADGDVYIAGEVAVATLDDDALDVLLGATVAVAEEMFVHALEIGFASYLERDRAYRAGHQDR
jgi:hypothetical protein